MSCKDFSLPINFGPNDFATGFERFVNISLGSTLSKNSLSVNKAFFVGPAFL